MVKIPRSYGVTECSYQLWKGISNIHKTQVSPCRWFPGWEASGAEAGADALGILLPANERERESSSFCSLHFLLFHTCTVFLSSEGTGLRQGTKPIKWRMLNTDRPAQLMQSPERSLNPAHQPTHPHPKVLFSWNDNLKIHTPRPPKEYQTLIIVSIMAHEITPWTMGFELKLQVISIFFHETLNTGLSRWDGGVIIEEWEICYNYFMKATKFLLSVHTTFSIQSPTFCKS